MSAGDIVFNLLSTATKEDIVNLVNKLDNDKKIFGLLNASSEDEFLFTISMILGDVKMSTTSIEKLVSTTPELLAKGNFIYFSMALSKNNYESLNENERKIYLSNGGHLILSDSPYDHLNELDYREKYASNKVFFDPLELVVLFAEDDIDTNIIKLKRGDSALLPACLVYLLFKEDTNRATSFLIAILSRLVLFNFNTSGCKT